jgi:hypothetical protein
MLKGHTETEYHLTSQGWLKGSFWVCGAKIEDVPAPSVRIESWIEEIDGPSGGAVPNVSWRRIWESDSATQHATIKLVKGSRFQSIDPWKNLSKTYNG